MEDEVMLQLEDDVKQLRNRVKRLESKIDTAMDELRTEFRKGLESIRVEMCKMFDKMLERVGGVDSEINSSSYVQIESSEVQLEDLTGPDGLKVFQTPKTQPLIQESSIEKLKINTTCTKVEYVQFEDIDFLGVEQFSETLGTMEDEKLQVVMNGKINFKHEIFKSVRLFHPIAFTYEWLPKHLSDTNPFYFLALLPTLKPNFINYYNQTKPFDPGITKPSFTYYNVIYKLLAEFTLVSVGSYLVLSVRPIALAIKLLLFPEFEYFSLLQDSFCLYIDAIRVFVILPTSLLQDWNNLVIYPNTSFQGISGRPSLILYSSSHHLVVQEHEVGTLEKDFDPNSSLVTRSGSGDDNQG